MCVHVLCVKMCARLKIVYILLYSIILYFLFKHWSLNHVLQLLVCSASSEDSLPSGRFQHWSLLLVRRNETQRNNEWCGKLFSSCNRGTLKYQKSQNRSCTQTSAAQILYMNMLLLLYYCSLIWVTPYLIRTGTEDYSYAPRNDRLHIRWWSHKIIILT